VSDHHMSDIQPLILVADDDAVSRLIFVEVLEAEGFRTIEAENGLEAIAQALANKPDLIILDVIMPGMDGLQACTELRAKPGFHEIPILVLTGLDDDESLDRAFHAGATDFATKPVVAAMLAHRVRYMLRTKKAMDDLRHSRARLSNAQRIARLGNWEYDPASGALNISGDARRMMGLPDRDLMLDSFLERIPGDDAEKLRSAIRESIETGTPFGLDHRAIPADGTEIFVHTQAAPILADGRVVMLAGTGQDITERVEAEQKVRTLAFYDTLTGLPNRILFTDMLRNSLGRASRRGDHVAVMFLDLDGFKSINDTLGHSAGDRVLEKVSARLHQVTRDYDPVGRSGEGPDLTIGRLGGDEFLFAIADLPDPAEAASVATRILESLHRPLLTQDGSIRVTGSMGVSVFPQDGTDVDELLKNADAALYHAKDSGRNTFEFYSPQLTARTLERVRLEEMLRTAVERGEFVLHYQPQIDAASGRITGAEALIRWNHPQKGVVGPGLFMDALEQTGLIRPLGPWIVKTAVSQLREWRDAGLGDLRMAINLSGEQLREPEIADALDRVVLDCGIAPDHVEFEITESVLIANASSGIGAVDALKAHGYRIAMDDFGTGYSSLSYLTLFPVDCIKIDRSFTRELLQNPTQAAIVETIIDLSRRLRLELVAEGVELPEQRDRLLASGCHLMQGYFFGRPMPAKDFHALASRSAAQGRDILPLALPA
jgi:diguanylate cyclase (GGDEF)-like protein/PAS domain S-box-containing protein